MLDYYCTQCNENFTTETIWDVYTLDSDPICESCYDELCAFL